MSECENRTYQGGKTIPNLAEKAAEAAICTPDKDGSSLNLTYPLEGTASSPESQGSWASLKKHGRLHRENDLTVFLPTAKAIVTFDTYERCLSHLNNNIIFIWRPEDIRGGGLLKYCDLTNQCYTLAFKQKLEKEVLECRMVVRFLMDFPNINDQHREIRKYIYAHFPRRTKNVESFLRVLLKIIQRSTVQTKDNTIRLILNFIDRAAQNGFARQNLRRNRGTMLPAHVQRRLARDLNIYLTPVDDNAAHVKSMSDYITDACIPPAKVDHNHMQPQTKNTYINPIFMPHISFIGTPGERYPSQVNSVNGMPYNAIIPPYLQKLHELASNKAWTDSLEAVRAWRGYSRTTPKRKYTSLSARSKQRHSQNPSFWIRSAEERRPHLPSQKQSRRGSNDLNRGYRGSHSQRGQRNRRGTQRRYRASRGSKQRNKLWRRCPKDTHDIIM